MEVYELVQMLEEHGFAIPETPAKSSLAFQLLNGVVIVLGGMIEEAKRNKEYCEEVMKCLSECETQEARDCLRKAQFFVNMANRETTQNETYFIGGLAAILSGTTVGISLPDKMEKMRKTASEDDERKSWKRI